MSPNLKPRRMPCLTHALTRQPVAVDESGSAARAAPDDSASRSRANVARTASRSASAPAATCRVISDSSMAVRPVRLLDERGFQHAEILQHLDDLLARLGLRRAHRQPISLLEQPH